MVTPGTAARRIAIGSALLLPWLMLLVTNWTVTPLGMVDAWIYRALGGDLVNANVSLGDYYYAARPFVLVPRYLLTRLFPEDAANFAYGLLCAQVLLLAVFDFLTSVARPTTRLPGVVLFGTCLYLVRCLGWGYVDGSLITWFMVGLAGVARWYRAQTSPRRRVLGALVAGGCFVAMLTTHPMTAPMLLTPLGLIALSQRQTKQARAWLLWLTMFLGGLATVASMGAICRALYGRFFYFMPIIDEALRIKSADWKHPVLSWFFQANWLVPVAFGGVLSALALLLASMRRRRLTSFEAFAYLNAVVLMVVMTGLEIFTPAYWLEYSFFTSYFLPSTLLAIAALLGERSKGNGTSWTMGGLIAVFAIVAGAIYRLESPYYLPSFGQQHYPFRVTRLWLEAVPLAGLQWGIATLAAAGLIAWRWTIKRPKAHSVLCAGALVALVTGGPINFAAPGDAADSQAAASVATAIGLIQAELKGRRASYWYDDQSPLRCVFLSISSAHLASYSHLSRAYPQGARSYKVNGYGSFDFFEKGDAVVILDDTPQRFVQAQQAFAAAGIELNELRREELHFRDRSYWLIIGTLEPRQLTLGLTDSLTTLTAAVTSKQERVSEREKGFLAFGPYMHLKQGKYQVTFHLQLLGKADGDDLGFVEAGAFSGTPSQMFQTAPLLASTAGPDGMIDKTLEFTLKEEASLAEFRVVTAGNSRLAFRSISVQPPAPAK